jgi:hypothetical protein
MPVNTARHQAIKKLRDANTCLHISATLPVMPDGLKADGLAYLDNAKQNGVEYDTVNLMTMDYYNYAPDMGAAAVNASEAVLGQLKARGLSATVGLTPMIGTVLLR